MGPESIPEDPIFRAIIVSPSIQLPWAWLKFSLKPYSGSLPLLLVHRDPLPYASGFDRFGSILTHQAESEAGEARLNAKLWMVSSTSAMVLELQLTFHRHPRPSVTIKQSVCSFVWPSAREQPTRTRGTSWRM